jgi:hypothetical protein
MRRESARRWRTGEDGRRRNMPVRRQQCGKRQRYGRRHGKRKQSRGSACKGNPNSLDEQLFTQDLARGNPKLIYK